jgi:hydrogenase nickel incorporation protein HypB
MKVKVVTRILEANDRIAEENARLFKERGIFVINLMGGPGAGKTSVLERLITGLAGKRKIGVIEGDIAGTEDAERINALQAPVVQINTGSHCHLDANMISEVLPEIDLKGLDILIIENVGNLVCPAEFSVGEDLKIMVLSVTEGHDKPLKYPLMFQKSGALIINKLDLLPHVNTDIWRIRQNAHALNPAIKIFEVSSKTGDGFPALIEFISWLSPLSNSLHG